MSDSHGVDLRQHEKRRKRKHFCLITRKTVVFHIYSLQCLFLFFSFLGTLWTTYVTWRPSLWPASSHSSIGILAEFWWTIFSSRCIALRTGLYIETSDWVACNLKSVMHRSQLIIFCIWWDRTQLLIKQSCVCDLVQVLIELHSCIWNNARDGAMCNFYTKRLPWKL